MSRVSLLILTSHSSLLSGLSNIHHSFQASIKMGVSQSKSATPADQNLVDQLRVLAMQDKVKQQEVDQGYVHVESEKIIPEDFPTDASLSPSSAKAWEKELLSDPKNQLALAALMSNPLNSIVVQKVATQSDAQLFNITIPFEGAPVTNQRSSGRCWLFASTNIFRLAVMKKHNLKEFELSQAYLFFWDKLEKSNYFLTQMIETAGQDLDSREVQRLFAEPISDGGQWDMVVNLVNKYGLVPHTLYPDSFNAMSSGAMDKVITTKLREDALTLRSLAVSQKSKNNTGSLLATKAKMMQEIHRILTLMLGPPPKPDQKFTWEFYDANQKYQKVTKTPLDLAQELTSTPSLTIKSLNFNVNEMFSIINDPRNKYYTHLTVSRLGNIVEGRPISYVNVPMPVMKKAAIDMLKAGIPLFFGCDVGKYSDSTSGIMDPKLFDYDLAFNISLGMSKSQRLKSGESAVTHAMVLTAVHVENGQSVRWRVENSWGDAAGQKGFFVMTDDWMDEFVYQIVVDPKFVSKEVRDARNSEAIKLPLWDPLGALA